MTLFSTCSTEKLKDAMVEFDKAFIPVFYYVYNENMEEASKAMLVLKSKWKVFNSKFDESEYIGHNCPESFLMISAWLEDAEDAINNQNPDWALIQLDHVRYELMDLRWREDMNYYLDKVWDLEATIDIVVQVSSDEMLDLIDWREFLLMTYDLEDAWNDVASNSWEERNFKFDTYEEIEEANRKLALKYAIKDFFSAVDYADRCNIENAAKEMEASYLEYIFFFGDFDATRTFYAAEFVNQ